MVVELHEWPASAPCRAVRVLANRIGLDIKTVTVNLHEKAHLEPDFKNINPFHTVPAINDDGFHLFESRAILVYMINKYAPESDLYPKDIQKRALVDAMLSFDSGTLSSALVRRVRTIVYTGHDVPEAVLARGQDTFKCLDNVLSSRKYAAGDHLTLADISIVHTLSLSEALEDDLSSYIHLTAYKKSVAEELGSFFTDANDKGVQAYQAFIKDKRKQ